MRTALLSAAMLLALQLHASAADPAAGWRGVKVLPKLGAVVKVGNETIDDPQHSTLRLPWIVQDVKGEWLWVGNHRKGWVPRNQVVTLDEAPAYYTQLINSGQQKAWAYLHRGVAWNEKGELDLAIADYGETLRLEPDAVAYNNRGTAWESKKDYDKAIADYNQAIRLDPNYATAYVNRGAAWDDKKDHDKAIADYDQALRLDPNDAFAYNNRGNAWNDKKEYDKAIADYDQALRLDPNYSVAYTNRGDVSYLKEDYDKAIADYSQSLRLDPNYAIAYQNRGRLWRDKKEYDKAIADFDQALHLNPKDADSYSDRGAAWSAKKDYDKAISDYNQALRVDPNSDLAYNNAAWLRATCPDEHYRNGAKAVALATKACELGGWTKFGFLDTLAAACAEVGDFDAAIKYQNKAIELNPNDAEFVKGAQERLALYKDHKPYREE